MKGTCRILVAITLVAVATSSLQAQALIEETLRAARCSGPTRHKLPKKMTLFQVVTDDVFAASETKTVFFNSGYWFRGDVNPGKVIVKATLIKMDGTEIPLPNLKERLEFCCAARSRAIDQDLEPGDMIQWDILLRRHSALLPNADCWSMTVGIATVE